MRGANEKKYDHQNEREYQQYSKFLKQHKYLDISFWIFKTMSIKAKRERKEKMKSACHHIFYSQPTPHMTIICWSIKN